MTSTTSARIVHVSDDPVRQIRLSVTSPYPFEAGQYLFVELPDGERIPLSIASCPEMLPALDLHFQPMAGDRLAARFTSLLDGTSLQISNAQGDAVCPEPDASLLLIAGGVGASHAFACARHRDAINAGGTTRLLWCGDTEASVYRVDELTALLGDRLNVIIDPDRTAANRGLIWLKDHLRRQTYDRYLLSGSPGFVYACTDVLTEAGASPDSLRSDVYHYAPRTP